MRDEKIKRNDAITLQLRCLAWKSLAQIVECASNFFRFGAGGIELELSRNLGDGQSIEGGVSRRVSSLPEPPERSDTPCREIQSRSRLSEQFFKSTPPIFARNIMSSQY